MATHQNPFTPSFGEIPLFLAGREQLMGVFEEAFKAEERRPELTTLLSGPRGMGKTTVLSVLSQEVGA